MSKKSKSAKKNKIRLVSTAKTGYFYTTTKNPKLGKKLSFKKYDPVLRQHVVFEEAKMK